jgi:two-component system NtrC family response regulator
MSKDRLMKPQRLSLLIVEDERPLARLWTMELDSLVEATLAHSIAEGREKLRGRGYDVVLLDLHLPDGNGLELLQEIHQRGDDSAVIILTGNADLESAIQAVRYGAYDYLVKPCKIEEIETRLRRIAREQTLANENLALKQQLRTQRVDAMELIGNSALIADVKKLIARVAPSEASVLINGETGTGKEVVARLIHANSERKDGPFVPVNCAALPRELAESELFGHRKGAFTGADRDHRGLVQAASGGTLFLDEIGDLPADVQAKFLRLLESKEGRRVGDSEPYKTDVRVVAATHRDLRQDVTGGKFRQDLFYRLATFELKLPPLRNIPEDLPTIAQHLLDNAAVRNSRAKRFANAALGAMRWYAWPGNVRELRNVIERAKILCDGDDIGPEHLNLPSAGLENVGATAQPNASAAAAATTLADMEWRMIQAALRSHGGNKTAAARSLGISLRTLYNKLEAKAHEAGLNKDVQAPPTGQASPSSATTQPSA